MIMTKRKVKNFSWFGSALACFIIIALSAGVIVFLWTSGQSDQSTDLAGPIRLIEKEDATTDEALLGPMRQDRTPDMLPDDGSPRPTNSAADNDQSDPANPVEKALRGMSVDRAVLLAHFADTAVSLEQRKQHIESLARARNNAAKEELMALGDAHLYLNRYAVAALGSYRDADTRRYLKEKLRDPDARIVCAAVRALASSAGAAAVPDLADVIRKHRRRADGHGDMVCQAAAETLGHIASPQAVPILTKELLRSEEPGWSKEYGSTVISALKNIGNADGLTAILAYADRLAGRIPEDPLARDYFETKIKEARAAAKDMAQ